ncbi:alpha/beta fold hydrolase [Vibrio sp. OCN044]|uniref:Alpha/beta fold hydrolase n=1 Tax=Vibrio tetraodonis subsp. pristinus TaxID=2695891 RepID=A0A6L8LTM6_9VIBR|nr:alpha/beta hydrolase [Vibrio tetraodonis]MYM59421.1 alpha/beta fold hydrolase [Vibrio tetraodonis subsp. pristinus]
MSKFTLDAQKMAYTDIGQGPVIVFGHAYLWSREMWAPQVEVLSKKYRCIVPDFWAHGDSDLAPKSMNSLVDYAKHLVALMDHLNIEQFSIVGMELGGMWGTEVVSFVPHRVKSLVMMDTFVGLEPEVAHNKYFSLLDMVESSQMFSDSTIESFLALFFASEHQAAELVAQFGSGLASLRGERAIETARIGRMIFGRRDQIEDIEMFALPVLIAVGEKNVPRPVLESYLMHDCITGSEFVQVQSAGHISNLEQPEFVSKMLDDFFTKLYQ